MTKKDNIEILDCDNSTKNYILIRNGEPIAEIYEHEDVALFAAAPDLLEALKKAKALIYDMSFLEKSSILTVDRFIKIHVEPLNILIARAEGK